MQPYAAVLGSDFSNWAQLTEQYSQGMDALRRREPGASAKMMEIARQLSQYALLTGQQPIPPMSVEPETHQVSPLELGTACNGDAKAASHPGAHGSPAVLRL